MQDPSPQFDTPCLTASEDVLQACVDGVAQAAAFFRTKPKGVFSGAGQLLKQNGLLMTYGVYAINGIITPSCNEQLDEELRQQNPDWGLPDIDVLRQLAYGSGLRMERMIEMDDYYKCLVFRKL